MIGMISGEKRILQQQMYTHGGMLSLVLALVMSDGVSTHGGEVAIYQNHLRSHTLQIIWVQIIVPLW